MNKRPKIWPSDEWFSKCVRERAGWVCERCAGQYQRGAAKGLHCSHWISRGKKPTRWHPRNAFAHCFACHVYLTMNDGTDRFRSWILSKALIRPYTEEELDKLMILSTATHKHSDWLDHIIEKHYQAEHKRLVWLQDQGVDPKVLDFKNWSDTNEAFEITF